MTRFYYNPIKRLSSVAEENTSKASMMMPVLIYFLYLAALFFGVTAIIAVIVAYINQDEGAGQVANSHFQYQIRTFWIGLLYLSISTILVLVLIGWLLYLLVYLWLVIRCIKGLKAADRGVPVANPTNWLI